jgi:hypothetical protein
MVKYKSNVKYYAKQIKHIVNEKGRCIPWNDQMK